MLGVGEANRQIQILIDYAKQMLPDIELTYIINDRSRDDDVQMEDAHK